MDSQAEEEDTGSKGGWRVPLTNHTDTVRGVMWRHWTEGYKLCSILPTLLMTLLRRFCKSRRRLCHPSDKDVTRPKTHKHTRCSPINKWCFLYSSRRKRMWQVSSMLVMHLLLLWLQQHQLIQGTFNNLPDKEHYFHCNMFFMQIQFLWQWMHCCRSTEE